MALVHGQGAVHRDLKSDNILVDRRGIVRVVDFGLAAFADRRLGFAPGSLGTFTYMAPETLQGRSTPASDVYSLGLLMYELFTGGGPHLSASWSTDEKSDHRDEFVRLKKSLRFPPPSEVQNEIRNDYRWLDALILRCLETDPERRMADAGKLLTAIETCEAGGDLPEESGPPAPPGSTDSRNEEADQLFREVRRLLAVKKYDQAIDRLDVHRPAEWVVLDRMGGRTLRHTRTSLRRPPRLRCGAGMPRTNCATSSVGSRGCRRRITPPPCRTFIGVIAVCDWRNWPACARKRRGHCSKLRRHDWRIDSTAARISSIRRTHPVSEAAAI